MTALITARTPDRATVARLHCRLNDVAATLEQQTTNLCICEPDYQPDPHPSVQAALKSMWSEEAMAGRDRNNMVRIRLTMAKLRAIVAEIDAMEAAAMEAEELAARVAAMEGV